MISRIVHYKFTDEDREQRILMDSTIDTFVNGQLESKRKMKSKWGGLCEEIMNM